LIWYAWESEYVSNGFVWLCRLCRAGVAWVASRRVYCDLVSFIEGFLWACLISRSCIMPHAITCRYPMLINRGVSPENMAMLIFLGQQDGGKEKAIGAC